MAGLGIIASVLQIANIGLRLSLRLYTLGERVASADKSIISISKDVSMTSDVLKELDHNLESDRASRICSPQATDGRDHCQMGIREEVDQVLVKILQTQSLWRKRREIEDSELFRSWNAFNGHSSRAR